MRLQADDDVAGTLIGGFGNETVDERFAVARNELNAGGDALLGVTVGKEVRGDGFGVAAQRGFFLELETG